GIWGGILGRIGVSVLATQARFVVGLCCSTDTSPKGERAMSRFRSFTSLAAVAGVALISTGCLRAPVVPPYGILYSDIQAPLDHDFDNTSVPTGSGTSESISILGLVAIGDASINEAAREGNL